MATTLFRPPPLDLKQSFSFYVPGRDPVRLRDCSQQGDAIVVSGAAGPKSVYGLRRDGWDGIALFDRAAYLANPGRVDPPKWFDQQEEAGADRLLTPGLFVGASKNHAPFELQVELEVALAQRNKATCVLCIDSRWLTKSEELLEMRTFLEGLDVTVALVLADRGDPLSHPGAVDGLTMLTRRIRGLSILRCDHGAIGALAFNAAHGSIGLQATYRHAVPPEATASTIPNDQTARVFVRDLMDWFTASKIGGWSTTQVSPRCGCDCCEGREIVRFLDPRYAPDADLHNRLVLSDLALEILQIPDETLQRQAFSERCRKAIENYGSMGTRLTELKPKPQLEQWAQYA